MDRQSPKPAAQVSVGVGNTRFDLPMKRVKALLDAGYTVPQAQYDVARAFCLDIDALRKEMGRRGAAARAAKARKQAGR
jgi:hypothetical protein